MVKGREEKKTLLTPIMVEEVTDPRSVSMAKTHFSEAVEHEIGFNGDLDGTDLCHDARSWWESEDLPASIRVMTRLSLRNRLVSLVDFKT